MVLRGPLAISPPSVNINMCHHSTLLQGTAYYLTYFTTNYSSNDLSNGSFKGDSTSPQNSVLTLETVVQGNAQCINWSIDCSSRHMVVESVRTSQQYSLDLLLVELEQLCQV